MTYELKDQLVAAGLTAEQAQEVLDRIPEMPPALERLLRSRMSDNPEHEIGTASD